MDEFCHDVAVFCKSFRDDFKRLNYLFDSLRSVGMDSYPFLVSIPRRDEVVFGTLCRPTTATSVIFDESYISADENALGGWLQQQVCKLAVHRTKFSRHYFMIDSDSYFVRSIDNSVFFTGDKLNIVCCKQPCLFWGKFSDNQELLNMLRSRDQRIPGESVNSASTRGFAERLEFVRANIQNYSSPDDRMPLILFLFQKEPGEFLQPGQIFHSEILLSFEAFLAENGLSLRAAIQLCPWEYNWYACYACAEFADRIAGVRPALLHFARVEEILGCKQLDISETDIARHFFAIQMGARHYNAMHYRDVDLTEVDMKEVEISDLDKHNIQKDFIRRQFSDAVKKLGLYLVLDIGAAEAPISKYLRSIHPNIKIIAFEPNPTLYEKATHICRDDEILVEPVAMGNHNGDSVYYLPLLELSPGQYDWRVGISSVFEPLWERSCKIFVPMRTASDYLAERGLGDAPCGMWIDAQGSIAEILRGACQVMNNIKLIRTSLVKKPLLYADEPYDEEVLELLKYSHTIIASSEVGSINDYEVLLVKNEFLHQLG